MNKLVAATPATRRPTAAFFTFIAAFALGSLLPAVQAAPAVPLVTDHLPGSQRNDISALLGMKITVGAEDLTR